jgi:hypothetical protein
MSFIGGFALLPVVLLTAASQGWAAPRASSAVGEIRRDLPERPIGSGTYRSALQRSAGDIESSGSQMIQLWAQNQQSPVPGPDQAQPPGEEKVDLNDQVIRDVFGPLQRGMESHNLEKVLAIFDQQQTTDYAQLRDRLRAFFDQYDTIRFRYQLLQATSDNKHGSAIAEIELEATPADPSQITLRRDTQMRFRMSLGSKGWRLVGFAPADFFAK